MKKVTVQIIIHLAAWACFLLLPLAFLPRPRDREFSIFTDRYYFSALFFVNFVIIVAFYYLNTYLFIPKLLDSKKFLGYTALILVCLVFYAAVPRVYHSLFPTQLNPGAGIGPSGVGGIRADSGSFAVAGAPGSAAPSDGIGPSRVAGSPDATGPAAAGARPNRGALARPPRPGTHPC